MAYNLPSFREREYVRIENVFILELVVWPFTSIVLLGSIVLVVKEHENILRTQSRESWNDYCLGEVPQAVFRNRR